MRTRSLSLLLLLSVLAPLARAQEPHKVKIITVSADVARALEASYGTDREVLWCVNSWTHHEYSTYDLVVVTDIHTADTETGNGHAELPPSACHSPDGTNLPTLHSHTNGTCQASPADLENIARRRAAFDGILCGPRAHTWVFAEDLVAAERGRFAMWLDAQQQTASTP